MHSFSDLCLIYGYTTADGRYSRSSHDVDIDDEAPGVNLGVCVFIYFFIYRKPYYQKILLRNMKIL